MAAFEQAPDASGRPHRLQLPPAPSTEQAPVKAWHEPVAIFTYLPEPADPNPMFLDKRVYQGSSGRVYPLPYIDRIATEGREHLWQAVHIENEYLRLMVLPEIGGRIHLGLDKRNGYDFFYRQNVIKPALVGLAGPWISGGVEFNWPQHHRPATFMPVEVHIERDPDGSVTIWCSDHDPMSRMKGMHGLCLHPGKAYVELKVRLYNRTPYVQTFLWWANVAARVHEHYQSFFPRDVQYVADHAKRAISRFPQTQGKYYGVDYAERARTGVPSEEQPRPFPPDGSYPANDLSWYANIPVPTSYMILGTKDDFFGGYDHAAHAGFVHVADHHIAPGKKQWTWGNHEFGYAWDRNLTENDGPYIELMAGVYTDNQPDFSFLAPGETKQFSQFWYPIQEIGVPVTANLQVALNFRVQPGRARLAVAATEDFVQAQILLERAGQVLAQWEQPLTVAQPVLLDAVLPPGVEESELTVVVRDRERVLLAFTPIKLVDAAPPVAAKEPALPEAIASSEELYLTGLHLEQYRHATRTPEAYWREALRRDEGDSRANHALGKWHLQRGEFIAAEQHFCRAIERLTSLNPNPYDGEVFYSLGLTLRLQKRNEEAYSAFYKATWNAGWKAPAYHALGELDVMFGRWANALEHLRLSLRVNMDNLNARNLAVVVLRRIKRSEDAEAMLRETRRLDPLDIWSRYLETGETPNDNRMRMDLALNYARSGLWQDAIALLAGGDAAQTDGSAPMLLYMLAWCHSSEGDSAAALAAYQRAANASPLYCFPNLLEDIEILETAIAADAEDARAPYYLGNLFYDRRRHEEAISLWERSVEIDPSFPTVWRNLGFAYFNIRHQEEKARMAFGRAFAANPSDARVFYEKDQLQKRIGDSPEIRLGEFELHRDLVGMRDDLAVELATLYAQTGRPEQALELLKARNFQPWEGGEGLVLGQWTRANLMLARQALANDHATEAISFVEAALAPPENLGEAAHLLANRSEIFYWAGVACCDLGNSAQARTWWEKAAAVRGDFREMSVQSVSDMTYWSALALQRLGQEAEALELFRAIELYSQELERQTPKIDYFATSLPAMLLFEENVALRNETEARFLRAQALMGLGRLTEAASLLKQVLERDRNQLRAADLLQDLSRQRDHATMMCGENELRAIE